MDKLSVHMENCYGIKSLTTTFNFNKKKAYVIYASNGSMKTSFTKTFKQLKEGGNPKEEIFGRESSCNIIKSNEQSIEPEEIFVIESYNESYSSKNVSNLLVNKVLQEKYISLLKEITIKKDNFINALQEYLGPKVAIESQITYAFNKQDSDFLKLLNEIHNNDLNKLEDSGLDFTQIDYTTLFDDKVATFVKDPKSLELLKEYSTEYNNLMDKTTFLKKGTFNQYNAKNINDSLNENGFFTAEHHLLLRDGKRIKSNEELIDLIQTEKAEILKDPRLLKRFEQIDKKLSANVQLRNFRILIENEPSLINQLVDFDGLLRNAWVTILKSNIEHFNALVSEYKVSASQINEIIQIAAKENEKWRHVVEIFTNRFYVPFHVSIKNQEEVVLKNSVPTLVFEYHEDGEKVEIDRSKLNSLLSGGERRALYLMNIIFEIEALKVEGKNVLVIADDIAESFDYKNKYAIIEYLQENVEHRLFNFIILTHNFDFYRTVSSRILGYDRDHCLMVLKKSSGIELTNGRYLKNIFKSWKDQLETNDTILVASIPFIRNIVEYVESEDCENYIFLTTLLHLVEFGSPRKTKEITMKELELVINKVWITSKDISYQRESKSIYSLILEVAEKINNESDDTGINLEEKVAFSMGIRLLAEEIMIKGITLDLGDASEIEKIKSNQTGRLLSLYKSCIGTNKDVLPVLEQVSLMTPENIHLNSFMYEPLIDISMKSLKDLYVSLKSVASEYERLHVLV
ncbi:hypothetical protein [Paenibacillus glacialis]|uniref:Protein CR006 P-loop domain-containing protein n=1 Tax=Paenibacillus glacialis TaxID=494026 RepID=A0A168M3F9_9BACL|nr:hypothetical protein [Paenibacillus glacialis]OAB44170.1 hypothetical protein PGLA_05725 [Paenibacillus glacialis]